MNEVDYKIPKPTPAEIAIYKRFDKNCLALSNVEGVIVTETRWIEDKVFGLKVKQFTFTIAKRLFVAPFVIKDWSTREKAVERIRFMREEWLPSMMKETIAQSISTN